MTDNVIITPGVGKSIAADEIGDVYYQRMKLTHGVNGVATDTSATDPLPVTSVAKARVSISGTIAVGGTAQTLLAAIATNAFLEIINPWAETESIWINDTGVGASSTDDDSYELQPGQSYTWPNGVTSAVSVVAATTGHKFRARKA